jgi:HEXXH motif-containing protein
MFDTMEQVKLSLSYHDVVWLPHLTKQLTEICWQQLGRTYGLTKLSYGTHRLISCNPNAGRSIITRLATQAGIEWDEPSLQIELPSNIIKREYEDAGVSFYDAEQIADNAISSCLRDAVEVLIKVPTLAMTIAYLVKSLHIIRSANDDCDVSFSEPHIPFSIFISVPSRRVPHDALRVAEGIVHEAMHLQLTLVERIVKLVNPSREQYYSPWRGEFRTAQGILHGLYVFRVVYEFLGNVWSLQDTEASYISKRRDQIAKQIAGLHSFQDCSDLTREGRSIVQKLLSSNADDDGLNLAAQVVPRSSCT